MSGALALSAGIAAATLPESVLIRPLRAIGYVIPDIVVEEHHEDQLVITEHPVERGASITDHAYKRPKEVVLRAAWFPSVGGSDGYLIDVYEQLVTLQESRQPFLLVTGKRSYPSMLLTAITVTTDVTREHMLDVSATCREIILVDTQTAALPAQNQATPSQTASTSDGGVKQAAKVDDPSLLARYSPVGTPIPGANSAATSPFPGF